MSEIKNSRLLGKITILVMVVLCLNTALALDGSGTQEDPWRIRSLDDFNDFAADANYWAGFTRLETDVNLAGRVYERAVIAPDVNDAEYGFQGIAFTGVFDGNDHKILNLTIDDGGAGNDYLGLFGYIDDSEVSNLGIEGVSINGQFYVGGLVGVAFDYSSVLNCYSKGSVSGYTAVGGLVGVAAGYSSVRSSVLNCYSVGNVNGVNYVGNLVGMTIGSITNCYSTGNVSGVGRVGGLVGSNAGSVSNCYSISDVNGSDYVGGLIGENYESIVSNCFWDTTTQTHGVTESIGQNDGMVTNVEGLPTTQLHQQSTFTDWDFINVWNIGENQTYPHLRTYLPSDINKDGIVNFLDFAIAANQWMEGQ